MAACSHLIASFEGPYRASSTNIQTYKLHKSKAEKIEVKATRV
jgi:hypothetical protein